MTRVECQYFPACSGCQFIGEDIDNQKKKKLEDLRKYLSVFETESIEIGWHSPGIFGLRDRLDFIWEDGRLGLYSFEKKQIINLESCGQLSAPLSAWYQEFRQLKWPIKKGSVRLRVGPRGIRGVWLDFANEDIKSLLDEKTLLEGLLSKAVVEIGQKRKILKSVDGQLKLREPEPQLWFESQFQGKAFPIFSYVGSFTQPSLKANQTLLGIMSKWVKQSGLKKASEFGGGIGNLSMMLLSWIDSLDVYESDALSIEAFKRSLQYYPEYFSQKKINFHVGDFHKEKELNFSEDEVLLVNPPRAGLKNFLESLNQSRRKPKCFIYMSCAPDTWARDGKVLKAIGYEIKNIEIVDQFPQTNHYEVISLWSLQ